MNNRILILGVPVDMVDMHGAVDKYRELMQGDSCSLVVTPNAEIVYNASGKDAELKAIIESADLIIPDGAGLVKASKSMGKPLKERVTGIDFLGKVLEELAQNKQSLYILGAAPGIAQKAAGEMRISHEGLVIAGVHDGYFKPEDEEKIVDEINSSGAHFLCVALGSPKQEKFIKKYQNRLKPRVAVGVGGSLDVWSGEVNRAPIFFQKHGLEWFYRLIKQPGRIKRMAVLPLFLLKVKFDKGGKNGQG